MGNLLSSGECQQVGEWHQLKAPICSASIEHGWLRTGISTGYYREEPTGVPAPDREIAFTLDGKYYSRPQKFGVWFVAHRGDIFARIAANLRIPAARVSEAAKRVVNMLMDMDPAQAREEAVRLLQSAGTDPAEAVKIVNALHDEILKPAAAEAARDGNAALFSGAYAGGADSTYAGGRSYLVTPGSWYSYAAARYTDGNPISITGGKERVGGCGCSGKWLGAYGGSDGGADTNDEFALKTASEYAGTANAATKTRIIADLLDAAGALGITMTGSTQQEKVASMLSYLHEKKPPNEHHKRVCEALAAVINKTHGESIIDVTSGSPEFICQQVSEMLASLAAGMHTEFLAVYNDTRRVLKNLYVLKDLLRTAHGKLLEAARAGESSAVAIGAADDAHKLIMAELDRQIALLTNLLNVHLVPAEKNLASLLKAEKGLEANITRIDAALGTDEFGRMISGVLKGMGVTANFALLVDEALKRIGMTLEEYKNTNKQAELANKLMAALKGARDQDVHLLLKAYELLAANLHRRESIPRVGGFLEKAEKKLGSYGTDYYDVGFSGNESAGNLYGGAEDMGSYDAAGFAGNESAGNLYGGNDWEGGAEDMGSYDAAGFAGNESAGNLYGGNQHGGNQHGGNDAYPKTAMDKRVADRMKMRKLIFNSFYKQLNDVFDRLVNSLNVLSMKIGTDIPTSDKLHGFKESLNELDDTLVRNKGIYYALIGYYNDALSKSKKDKLLSTLSMIAAHIDAITADSLYNASKQYFMDVRAQIDKITELINTFSEQIAAKYGQGEQNDAPVEYDGGADEDESLYGADVKRALYTERALEYKPAKTIKDAIRQFQYKYNVAEIKRNLASTSAELDHYAENYDNLTAKSIADILAREQKIYQDLAESLDKDYSQYAADERNAAREFLEQQWKIKSNFWATVEAIDAYMRHFTDGVVKHPNDIQDIKSMLDSVEIISDWYSNKTGNDLAQTFDYFPAKMKSNFTTQMPASSLREDIDESKHYYEVVAAAVDNAAAGEVKLPGNPYVVTKPSFGVAARKRLRRALGSFSLLKNLLSIFVQIGKTFGGESLLKKVFMTPAQIYKNLMDYIEASAFAVGFKYDYKSRQDELYKTQSDAIKKKYKNLRTTSDTDYKQISDSYKKFQKQYATIAADLKKLIKKLKRVAESPKDVEHAIESNTEAVKMYMSNLEQAFANVREKKEILNKKNVEQKEKLDVYTLAKANLTAIDKKLDPSALKDIDEIINIANENIAQLTRKIQLHDALEQVISVATETSFDLIRDYKNIKNLGAQDLQNAINNIEAQMSAIKIASTNSDRVIDENIKMLQRLQQVELLLSNLHEQNELTALEKQHANLKLTGEQPYSYTREPVASTTDPLYIGGADKSKDALQGYKLEPEPPKDTKSAVADQQREYMRKYGIWMRSTDDNLRALEQFSFCTEDDYFVLLIKSIAAKILTVTGLYDVFDRPHEYNGLSPIRMIVGGSAETPKVDEGATALYLRLPLLAQFYRKIFGFEIEEDDNNKYRKYDEWRGRDQNIKISMIPDVDGVFAGLIRIVFRKNKHLEAANYSDDDLKDLVREINLIYQRMLSLHPQNTVMATINDFVAEVNRRYGIVSLSERKRFLQEFGYKYDYADTNRFDRYDEAPELDVAILPGEEDDTVPRMSNAQKLLGNKLALTPRESVFTISEDHKALVYRFRCALDKHFEDAGDSKFTFNKAIKLVQHKLKKEANDELRFKLVVSLIRGTNIYSRVDNIKYLLFHETVIAGLNTLSAIHSMLARFKQRVQLISIDDLCAQITGMLSTDKFTAADTDAFVDSLAGRLVGVIDSKQQIKTYLCDIFGQNENIIANGGDAVDRAGNPIDGQSFIVKRTNMPKVQKLTVNNDVISAAASAAHVLNGVKVDELKKRINDFMYFALDKEYVMKELLETLFALTNDYQGLVRLNVEDGRFTLSYGGLKTVIDELFESVHWFLNTLRPHVDAELYEKYVNKFTPGSYYWLQEQLMEKIIVGRPAEPGDIDVAGAPADTSKLRAGYANLDELMQKVNNTFDWLTREHNIVPLNGRFTDNTAPMRAYYGNVLAEMIFYDADKPQSGINKSLHDNARVDGMGVCNGGLQLVDFMTNDYDALFMHGPLNEKVLDTRYIARFQQLYNWNKDYGFNRSILFSFNQLIAKYIQANFDPATKKIHGGLITQFASGAFSRSIVDQTYTYPDVSPALFIQTVAAKSAEISPITDMIASLNVPDKTLYDNLQPAILEYIQTKEASFKDELSTTSNIRAILTKIAPSAITDFDKVGKQGGLREIFKRFPFSDEFAAQFESDKNYAADIVAILIAHLHRGIINAGATANIPSIVSTTINNLRAKKLYTPAKAIGPRILVKYPELLNTSTKLIDSATIPIEYDKLNYLVLARSDSIKNVLEPGSIDHVPTTQTPITGAGEHSAYAGGADHKTVKLNDIKNFGKRMDPDGDHVLFTSLAVVLKNITTSRTNAQVPVHMCESVADLPLYMKEKMRANLPVFRNLFKQLIAKAEFYKRVIGRGEISAERKFRAEPTGNPWPFVLKPAVDSATGAGASMSSEAAKRRFTEICDSIIRGCTALISGCEQSYREIGDDPYYFEIYQNSIKDYKNQYGYDPLMPISTLLAAFKNVNKANYTDHVPIHALGETPFKYLYGVRSLISNPAAKPLTEYAPGYAHIVSAYNDTSDITQVPKDRADKFLGVLVQAVRYVYELKHHKSLLTPLMTNADDKIANIVINTLRANSDHLVLINGLFTRMDLILTKLDLGLLTERVGTGNSFYDTSYPVLTNKSDVSIVELVGKSDPVQLPRAKQKRDVEYKYAKPVYAISKPLDDTIKLTESSFKEEKIKEIVEYLCEKSDKKMSLEVQNIIDLNIIPINVHALMRNIPLANLYNYAYTFDRLILELYYGRINPHASTQTAADMIKALCGETVFDGRRVTGYDLHSALDMFTSLILNPYKTYRYREYNKLAKHLQEIAAGAIDASEFGRPKFFSDEIYNKAIFGNLYLSSTQKNMLGPKGAVASEYAYNDRELRVQKIARVVLGAPGTPFKSTNAPKLVRDCLFNQDSLTLAEMSSQLGVDESTVVFILGLNLLFSGQSSVDSIKTFFSKIINTGSYMGLGQSTLHAELSKLSVPLADYLTAADAKANPNDIKVANYIAASVDKYLDDSVANIGDFNEQIFTKNKFTWVDKDNALKEARITSNMQKHLRDIGEFRFNTVLVRNLMLITFIYRSIRAKLQRDLTYSRDIIAKSEAITRNDSTEYYEKK